MYPFDDLSNAEILDIELAPGTYEIPDGWSMRHQAGKRVYTNGGLVRFVGRFIIDTCVDVIFSGCSFRAPVSAMGEWSAKNYDAVTVLNAEEVHFVKCSIIGGTDETMSIKSSLSCEIHQSIIGGCFEHNRNHDMAMLIECDGFKLISSIVTAADRRKPQIQDWHCPDIPSVISGNRIDGGRTMTVGLKPQAELRVDITNNVFTRTRRTKSAEVDVVNGSAGTARVFARGNFLQGTSTPIEIDESATASNSGFTTYAYSPAEVASMSRTGPPVRDSWDTFLLRHFGTGKTWPSESSLPPL